MDMTHDKTTMNKNELYQTSHLSQLGLGARERFGLQREHNRRSQNGETHVGRQAQRVTPHDHGSGTNFFCRGGSIDAVDGSEGGDALDNAVATPDADVEVDSTGVNSRLLHIPTHPHTSALQHTTTNERTQCVQQY
jgi:hypothetical protein